MPSLLLEEHLSPHILKITLRDLKSANALSLEAARELKLIIRQLKSRESRIKVLIFTGDSRFFCSGGNLKFYQSLKTKSQGAKINREISVILASLHRLPIYKMAWVNGDCFGGGLELMSCFDYIAAVPHSLFGFWQSRQALSFGWGGGARLAERTGLQFVTNALIASQTFSAAEAQQIGLIDDVFSRHEIEFQILEHAQKMIRSSDRVQSEIRKLNLKNEAQIFNKLWWSKDHRSRLQGSKKN